jgi:hypothetical protein
VFPARIACEYDASAAGAFGDEMTSFVIGAADMMKMSDVGKQRMNQQIDRRDFDRKPTTR